MTNLSVDKLHSLSSQLPKKIPYLKMLVLFGSQATGETHAESDWDFAVLYDETLKEDYLNGDAWKELEIPFIIAEIFNLNSDKIDVVNLSRCHSLIAHSVAVNGKLIYEKEAGEFKNFKQDFTLTSEERREIRLKLRSNIDTFLKEWGLA